MNDLNPFILAVFEINVTICDTSSLQQPQFTHSVICIDIFYNFGIE